MYYDLVIHVDDNDPARLNLSFSNVANYRAGLPGETFRIVLVANGPAVQLFTRDHGELADSAAKLMEEGRSIRLCNNALKKFQVSVDDLWDGCEVVPAGVVEVVKLQREGFAYLRP